MEFIIINIIKNNLLFYFQKYIYLYDYLFDIENKSILILSKNLMRFYYEIVNKNLYLHLNFFILNIFLII